MNPVSGAVFDWDCDERRCKLSRIGDEPALADCGSLRPTYSYSWGRFVDLSAVCAGTDGSWASLPGWGRSVVCEGDDDCPMIPRQEGQDIYVCHSGYCQRADLADSFDTLPSQYMMEQLCLGDIPRFEPYESSPELAAALEAACPGDDWSAPCTSLPAGCPDPRG